jgi:hypothetical protein
VLYLPLVKLPLGMVVGAAFVAASAGPALAQTRPLLTEPAVTAPAGTFVFETGFDVIADEPSYVTGVERTSWSGPLLRLVYSPAGNVELDLEWVARVGEWGEEGRGGAQSSDWGDVTLRAKWRIVEGRGGGPTLGARFGIALPETKYNDKQFRPLGLGPNTMRMLVEGLLTQPLGRARLHVDLGLFLQDEVLRPHEQRDFLSFGVAVERPVRSRLAVLAEVAGQAGPGVPGTRPHSEARAGLRFGSGRLKWDAAVRRGIAGADGTWGLTVGLAWTVLPR